MPNPKRKRQLVNDDPEYDLDPYYDDVIEKSDNENNWLLSVAGLLGTLLVIESLQPTGSIESPDLISSPVSVSDISDKQFEDILRMDASSGSSISDVAYVYSEDELKQFQQLSEELRQFGRLEDPRTLENIDMRWAEQINDKMGMFTDLEAYKSGALDVYIEAQVNWGASIKIPWNPTGPNTCDDCMAMVDEGPYPPDEFPEPVHFGDQCNDPMADPVIDFPDFYYKSFKKWLSKRFNSFKKVLNF